MTKRRMLNVSSEKKRDVMPAWSNIVDGGPGTEGLGGATFTGVANFHCVWSPTARGSTFATGLRGSKFYEQLRTSVTTYAVGVKETIRIGTNGPVGWHWRRVCFTMKGEELYTGDREDFDLSNSPVARITSDGMKRAVLFSEGALQTRGIIFKGNQNVDWTDVITAPLDTNRITPLFDRVTHIKSGNQSGSTRIVKLWHPMGKNIVYSEDQNGQDTPESFYSVTGKAGMGDYYIVDFFRSDTILGETGSSSLYFEPAATYYWHER